MAEYSNLINFGTPKRSYNQLKRPHLDMPLGDFIRRASTYILGTEEEGAKFQLYEDNEILFCKNNVCVHPLPTIRKETDVFHNPGYLTITTKVFVDQYTETKRPTLFLTWLPNSKFVKYSSTININSSPKNDSGKRNSIESLTSSDSNGSCSEVSSEFKSTNPFFSQLDESESMSESLSSEDGEKPGTVISINVDIANPAIEITTPDSIKDATESLHETTFLRSESVTSDKNGTSNCSPTDSLTQQPNSMVPDITISSPIVVRKTSNACRRFSVDLSQMRSLRLFFNDDTCTCGQLVVASRESQYKILHFHHGGLDHLAQILHQWHSLLHSIKYAKGSDENLPYRHFMVCRPEVSDLELHPEEGQVTKLTEDIFYNLFTECGQLEDDLLLRKYVFFAGMNRNLRKHVWPFLLRVYPYQTTYEERSQIMEIRQQEYIEITKRRLELNGSHLKHFNRNIKNIIEKDVVRTDRSNPFFAGDENPNLEIMKNILLNYSLFNSGLGYTQGMSDLLAPVLCELKDEVLSFWCFVGLMQRAVFVATPTDRDMDVSLRYLRNLIRIMVPNFYQHLEKHKDAMELLFCHRWILLCFKREFTEGVALRMWEACWANYLTDYFHLFLCLAIICVYAEDVITQDLKADEMLLYFSSLAMYMDGVLILRKARGLLHQFRQLREIPCSLADLCSRCGPGIWDSTHSPLIYCSGHEKEINCNICTN